MLHAPVLSIHIATMYKRVAVYILHVNYICSAAMVIKASSGFVVVFPA